MSAPMVSEVAALICSTNPTLSAAQVRRMLIWTAKDLGPKGFDNDTGNGCVDAYQAVYIALWMRDFRLLPDEKKTFSYDIDPVELRIQDLRNIGKYQPVDAFLSSTYSLCFGTPIDSSSEEYCAYMLALESGEITACELISEFLSKSTVSFMKNKDYLNFIFQLLLNSDPTPMQEYSTEKILKMENGRELLAKCLVESVEFTRRCQGSFVTVGTGLSLPEDMKQTYQEATSLQDLEEAGRLEPIYSFLSSAYITCGAP